MTNTSERATDQHYYWASETDPDKLGRRIKDKIENWRQAIQINGRMSLWRRATATYYGLDQDGTRKSAHMIGFAGREGEIAALRGNVFRAFVRQLVVMTTGSRPSFQCRPIAYDATTTEIVTLGNAICDKYLNDSMEQALADAMLHAVLLGEGWVAALWDDTVGKVIGQDPTTGRIAHVGDAVARAYRPDQIIRDTQQDGTDPSWIVLQRQRSRWDLAAQYPQYRDDILRATYDTYVTPFFLSDSVAQNMTDGLTGDMVVTYELFHERTDALPNGRMSILCGDTVIADGPIPYEKLPFFPIITSREPGSPHGYGESWDLLAMQSAFDSVLTQIVTVKENFGLRNVFVQTDTLDTDPIMIGAGMRVLQGTAPPVPIALDVGAVDEGRNALDLLKSLMQMLTGLNDASIGDSGKSSSGAALAMMHNLAQQFNSSLQRAYAAAFESTMTQTLTNLKKFATDERMIHIAGTNRAPLIKRFKADDLSALDGVAVEMGSAAMRSVGMRIETAKALLQGGAITAEQYLEIQATGRLEPITEGPRAQETRAEKLMELVMSGRGYTPLATDPHAECIQRLVAVLDDSDMREDAGITASVTALIQKHTDLWVSMSMPTNPAGIALLQATGQQPCAAAAMMPPPGAPPPGPNPGNPDAQPAAKQPGNIPRNAPVQGDGGSPADAPGGPSMPRMPPQAGAVQ